MSYASLGDLKSALRITDTDSDVLLQAVLDAATLAINQHCNRTFIADVVASARTFRSSRGRVDTDDFYTTSGLIVTIGLNVIPVAVPNVSLGYTVIPVNAAATGEPYTGILYSGAYPGIFYPNDAASDVVITAKWGYGLAIPATVPMACLLQASRWFARRNSPYGVAGSPDMGSELRLLAKLDADVAVMLAGLVRY